MAKLLLVEDDENQRLLYREALEERGHEVLEAPDGYAAVAAVERSRPDAVILDVHMPGMDGLDALVRLHDRHPRLPIILNTAYAGFRNRFVTWLADAYVTKSSRLDDLHDAIDGILGRPPAAD